jgi:hypothetical protein
VEKCDIHASGSCTFSVLENVMRIFMTSAGKYNIAGSLTPEFVAVVCKWSVLCPLMFCCLLLEVAGYWRRRAVLFVQGTERKRSQELCLLSLRLLREQGSKL